MRDITFCGMSAGLTGSVVNLTTGIIFKVLNITDRTFYDYGQVLIMFNPQKGFTAALVGSIAHLIIGTFCGLLFTHYLKATTFQNILTKGAFFGAFLWVSFLGAGSVFRLPIFTHVPPLSALLIFLNSLIYGFVTAYVLSKFSLAQPSK